jgi:hypothetical protein
MTANPLARDSRFMDRLRAIGAAMLRMVGLDDESMDREQARLTREYYLLRTKSTGPLSDWALDRMERALREARRQRPQ